MSQRPVFPVHLGGPLGRALSLPFLRLLHLYQVVNLDYIGARALDEGQQLRRLSRRHIEALYRRVQMTDE